MYPISGTGLAPEAHRISGTGLAPEAHRSGKVRAKGGLGEGQACIGSGFLRRRSPLDMLSCAIEAAAVLKGAPPAGQVWLCAKLPVVSTGQASFL